MVTLVDASRFLTHFEELVDLAELGMARDEEDGRSVVELLVDQVEFADVLVVSKPDLVDADDLARVVSLVRRLNPRAVVRIAERGELPLTDLLDTGLFDPQEAALAPGWVRELNGDHVPETDEYGISSFVYRHRWPFHAARLRDALEDDWPGVLRSKGFFWLATRPDIQAFWSQAGLSVQLEPMGPWLATVPEHEWELDPEDEAALAEHWDPLVGDRYTELVFIGIDMDEAALRERLDACVVTAEEFEAGPSAWAGYPDPFPAWELHDDHDER